MLMLKSNEDLLGSLINKIYHIIKDIDEKLLRHSTFTINENYQIIYHIYDLLNTMKELKQIDMEKLQVENILHSNFEEEFMNVLIKVYKGIDFEKNFTLLKKNVAKLNKYYNKCKNETCYGIELKELFEVINDIDFIASTPKLSIQEENNLKDTIKVVEYVLDRSTKMDNTFNYNVHIINIFRYMFEMISPGITSFMSSILPRSLILDSIHKSFKNNTYLLPNGKYDISIVKAFNGIKIDKLKLEEKINKETEKDFKKFLSKDEIKTLIQGLDNLKDKNLKEIEKFLYTKKYDPIEDLKIVFHSTFKENTMKYLSYELQDYLKLYPKIFNVKIKFKGLLEQDEMKEWVKAIMYYYYSHDELVRFTKHHILIYNCALIYLKFLTGDEKGVVNSTKKILNKVKEYI